MLMDHEWVSRMNIADCLEATMKLSEDFLFVIDQIKTKEYYSGIIIKKSNNDNYTLNDKVEYKEFSTVKCECDVPVYCVHKDNVIIEGEFIRSTSEINVTRKVEGSSVRSVIFANMEWFNHYDYFVRARINEYEDGKDYPIELTYALDYVDYMFRSDDYKHLSRVSRCKAAAKIYKLDWVVIKNANLARTTVRRWCKKKWYEDD